MIAHGNKIKLFAGNGSPELAKEIAKELNMPLGMIQVGKFSDGETSVQIGETVRGCDVFVLQSTSTPVNDNLIELLVMIDAMRRASAGRITAVIPYFGYARQDRKARARDPITANSLPILSPPPVRTECLPWTFTRPRFRDSSIPPSTTFSVRAFFAIISAPRRSLTATIS